MDFMARLAGLGLIHCDFNEFNVMVRPDVTASWFLSPKCLRKKDNDAKTAPALTSDGRLCDCQPAAESKWLADLGGISRTDQIELPYLMMSARQI